MNRNEEFLELKGELEQTPIALEYSAVKAIAKAKKSKRRSLLLKTPLISFCTVAVAFVLLVNLFPTVALAMSNLPILRELVSAVAFDSSLKAAVDNDYYQVIGESQTRDDVTMTIDYMILDAGHISIFYKVDAPTKEGELSCEFEDMDGNQLQAAICWDNLEIGKLKKIDINFSDNFDIPEEFSFTAQLYLGERYEDSMELLTKRSSENLSATAYHDGKAVGKYETFRFKLKPDKRFTQMINTISIDKWVEVKGQRIYLKNLDVYPTRARLNIDCDENNSAVLESLNIHFEDNKGGVYHSTGGVSAFSDPISDNINVLFYESSYFANTKHLTLYIDGITMIDKDKRYGEINYAKKTITNLPQGITVESMVLTDSTLEVVLKGVTEKKGAFGNLIFMQYYDLDDKVYDFANGISTNTDATIYHQRFQIPNYEDYKYKVKWAYAPMKTFDKPISIKLQ